MEDKAIIALYFARSEDAIQKTREKYGRYCRAIARNILSSEEEAEECEQDAYLKAWNAIPPEKPRILQAYLGRITRNLALNRYAFRSAKCRRHCEVALEELEECIPSIEGDAADSLALRDALNRFLRTLPKKTRILFLQRYFYLCPLPEIAKEQRISEGSLKMTLCRTRARLKTFLEKEGILL